ARASPCPGSTIPLVLAPPPAAIALRLPHARATLLVAAIAALGFALFLRDILVLPQTAESLEYLASWVLVLLTPVFGWLWPWLEKHGRTPSKPVKNALG